MITEIRDFLLLSDRLATAGQPTCDQFPHIRAAGYEVVINLVPWENPNFPQAEPEIVRALDMQYIGISVDWCCPSAADLHDFFEAMEKNKGRKLFVHCAANKRASAFVFLYRVLCLEMDEADAEDDMDRIWTPTGTWRAFLDEMLARQNLVIK